MNEGIPVLVNVIVAVSRSAVSDGAGHVAETVPNEQSGTYKVSRTIPIDK